MAMEVFDKTYSVLNDQRYKTLSDIIKAQPYSKEKILANLKTLLTSCINK